MQWVPYGVPSAFSEFLEDAAPIDRDEAIRFTRSLAQLLVGVDESLAVESALESGAGDPRWTVALASDSRDGAWQLRAVLSVAGNVWSVEIKPPAELTLESAFRQHMRAAASTFDRESVLLASYDVVHLIGGIYPGFEPLHVEHDGLEKRWRIALAAHYLSGPVFEVVIADTGDLLEVRRVVTE